MYYLPNVYMHTPFPPTGVSKISSTTNANFGPLFFSRSTSQVSPFLSLLSLIQTTESLRERMGRGKKRTEATSSPPVPTSALPKKPKRSAPDDLEFGFINAPIPSDEAKTRWPHRYQTKVTV